MLDEIIDHRLNDTAIKYEDAFSTLPMVISKGSTQPAYINFAYNLRMVIHIGHRSQASKIPILYNSQNMMLLMGYRTDPPLHGGFPAPSVRKSPL